MTHNLSTRSLQLDLFRGCAALLMVLNHAGYAWLAPEDSSSGFSGALVFLGSAAPALFFFATGVGMGLSRKASVDWPSLWRKVALLFIADAFLNWAEGRWLGLDFFGFCAIAMVAVGLVNAAPRPKLVASVVLVLVFALRYADAPRLQLFAPDAPWLAFLTGVEGVPGVSYPLCPWLAFPLAGYLLGRASPRLESMVAYLGMLAWAALTFGVALVMAQHGAVVHRWGSVSITYFMFAVGFVASVWLLARGACALAGRSLLQLRGPASLLVVPIHYAAIHLCAALVLPPWPLQAGLAAMLALALCTLPASRWLAGGLKRIAERPGAGTALLGAVAAAAACCSAALEFATPLVCWLVACLSQIVIAANLARPPRMVIKTAPLRTL